MQVEGLLREIILYNHCLSHDEIVAGGDIFAKAFLEGDKDQLILWLMFEVLSKK